MSKIRDFNGFRTETYSYENIVGKYFFDIPVPSDGFFKYLLPGANNGLTFFTVQ